MCIRDSPESPLRNTETTVDGLRSTLQQEAALVPVQAGNVVLPAIRVPWWNTETDKLEQAILPERRYTITGNSAVAAAPVPDNSAPETPPATLRSPQMTCPRLTARALSGFGFRWYWDCSGWLPWCCGGCPESLPAEPCHPSHWKTTPKNTPMSS